MAQITHQCECTAENVANLEIAIAKAQLGVEQVHPGHVRPKPHAENEIILLSYGHPSREPSSAMRCLNRPELHPLISFCQDLTHAWVSTYALKE